MLRALAWLLVSCVYWHFASPLTGMFKNKQTTIIFQIYAKIVRTQSFSALQQQCNAANMVYHRSACFVRDISSTGDSYDVQKHRCTQFSPRSFGVSKLGSATRTVGNSSGRYTRRHLIMNIYCMCKFFYTFSLL